MNTQLVESLVKVINSLSSEEKNLLQEKLQLQLDCDDRWEETLERIEARREKIHASLAGQPFKPSVTEIIHQMREERDKQLMQACFPQEEE
ncbi:MAG: hypothetical protein ACRC2S_15005 [Waterburya sp.]